MDENKLDITIESLGLSERVTNAFKRSSIKTLGDLSDANPGNDRRSQHLGRKSLEELLSRLKEIGIQL